MLCAVIPLEHAMPRPHRYTGAFPPIEVIADFSNWDYALDEESEPDQDETTIRPEAEQTFITKRTAFSAADAFLANGEQVTALVEVLGGQVWAVNVFQPKGIWRLFFDKPGRAWQPFIETWLPEDKRCHSVALSDRSVFPLRVTTRLPLGPKGQMWRAIIQPDGSETAWA